MAELEEFDTGHKDRVTVLHINYYGTRILTGSIDHRIKVWDRDISTGQHILIDTFTAHDADIRDAKWLHPTTGSHIATIGNDLKFCLWQEDPSQAPASGRRFRPIYTIRSKARVPFVSLDIRNIDNIYTVLAMIDRQGLLSIYEPTNPDEFKDWTLVDQFNVCSPNPAPGRGEETSFKVRFDPNVTPLPYMNSLTNERKQLSLVVTAMREVKIYHSVSTSHAKPDNSDSASGASYRFKFFEATRLPTHPTLVRDVAWAPFNCRGYDRIATACKDGAVRIFDLAVTGNNLSASSSAAAFGTLRANAGSDGLTVGHAGYSTAQQQQQKPQSSLTSAITGAPSTAAHHHASATSTSTPSSRTGYPFPYKYTIISPTQLTSQSQPQNRSTPPSSNTNTAQPPPHQQQQQSTTTPSQTPPIPISSALATAHADAHSVSWDPQGQVLLSHGSDGTGKFWRRAASADREWLVFAEQVVEKVDVLSVAGGEGGAEGSDDE